VIRVPAGAVSISADGTLSVKGAVGGRVRLTEFSPDTPLTSEGQALLTAPECSALPARHTSVLQGAIESSNVNAVGATVTLIGVQRQAEMMQRALSIFYTEFNRIATGDLPRV
jgi:flagellar basal-body rod protein FlgF/flagellar basal-body rod protein FlgG